MSDERRDPIEHLRAAWRDVPIPPATRELDDEDPATRASVEWLQDAWNGLDVPAAPGLPERPRPRALPPLLPWIAAAAASWLIAVALGLAGLDFGGDRQETASLEDQGEREELIEAPSPPPVEPAPVPTVVRTDDDGSVEMVSGSVRLVLLPPSVPLQEEES